MKIGTRIVDSYGNMGTIKSFRQHPYNKDVQEAEITFDELKAGAYYNHRPVNTLRELNAQEPLKDVLSELYQNTSGKYEGACQGGNDHAQYVLGAQLDILRLIAARVLNAKLS
jgi:hypothetical protein